MALNVFSSRVAIGRTVDASGKATDVFMTPEFYRLLSTLSDQMEADTSVGENIELLALEASIQAPAGAVQQFDQQSDPAISMLMAEVQSLRRQVQGLAMLLTNQPAPVGADMGAVEMLSYAMVGTPAFVDWTRPGKIGSSKANTGKFTTLQATGAATLAAVACTTLSSSGQALLAGAATVGSGFGTIGSGSALFKSFTGASVGISVGGSGGGYGEVGYNIDFQAGSGTYKYLVADTSGSLQFSGATILVKGAGAGAAGAALTLATWATFRATGLDNTPVGTTNAAAGRFTTLATTGSATIATGFGCNTKAAQTAAASGGNMTATAATNVSPYGFTTAAQADQIAVKLNAIQNALVANGIMS